MDHDYELEEEYAPRILWGRLAFFLLALVLAFVGGRACAPSGVSEADFRAAQAQVADLTTEKAQLQQQLDAQQDADPGGGGDGGGGKGNGGKNDGSDAEAEATEDPSEGSQDSIGEGDEYEVQTGDTLYGLAEKFYGDTGKAELIAEANNLDLSTPLVVGQVLIIPPDDE